MLTVNDQIIWNFLFSKLLNPYGAAALMGNLYVESGLNPTNLQNTYNKKLGMSDQEYTEAVDSGAYINFVNDGAGYGLLQWTYWSRKENLLNFAKETNTSIGDLNVQLVFLWKELQTYKTCLAALKEARSIREASDVLIERYIKPSSRTEESKANRANFGQKFYNMFSGKRSGKSVVVNTSNTNIRSGNGKEYAKVGRADKDDTYDWIASSSNNWHAVKLADRVGWISGEFSSVE